MVLERNKLAEKMILALYALSESTESINLNTFKRYIYLYYLTSAFLSGNTESIDIVVDKGDIKIINFDSILNDFYAREYITLQNNQIIINEELQHFVKEQMLKNEQGMIYSRYKEIRLFINLLKSYNDQFIFTIFFSEPTFNKATVRGLKEIRSTNSKLNELLKAFKTKVNNISIDEYDILSYWMEFILKNYYIEAGEVNE